MFRKTKRFKEVPSVQGRDVTHVEPLETRTLLSAAASTITIQPNIILTPNASGSSSIQGYTPAEIKSAYGFTGVSGNGSGQTIAIVDAYNDPNIASDLNVFDSQFGLPSASLSVVSETGGSVKKVATDPGWAGEISLDVEWAHAIAPDAKILLVEASSDSLSDLLTAVNDARNAAGVSVVSMSWGGSEFTGQTQYDSYFTTPSGHQGVTFVASAGDSTAAAAEWPAASPNVLSVGGTTLATSSSGAYASESAWSDGGGGYSTVESEPSYQQKAQSTGSRSTPDVAYDADPNTGFAIYDSLNDDGYVGWQEVGGTSAGAPQWSALIAIADQGRVAEGKGTLDGPTGTLPTLYGVYDAPNSSTYSAYTAVFHDVTTGVSGETLGGGGYFWGGHGRGGGGGGEFVGEAAGPGYDAVTGLGTPQAGSVISALEGLSNAAAERAIHAAHYARTVNRASGAKGTANPGIVDASSTSVSSATTANVSEGVDAAVRVQLDAASDGVGAGGTLASAVFATAPASLAVSGAASEPAQTLVTGMSRFAGAFAVAGAQSPADAAALWSAATPSAALAFEHGADGTEPAAGEMGAAKLATGPLVPAEVTQTAVQITGAVAELMPLTPALAFADATAGFADECASVLAAPSPDATVPWAVAAAVLGLNGVLIGYWTAKRRADKAAEMDGAEPE